MGEEPPHANMIGLCRCNYCVHAIGCRDIEGRILLKCSLTLFRSVSVYLLPGPRSPVDKCIGTNADHVAISVMKMFDL